MSDTAPATVALRQRFKDRLVYKLLWDAIAAGVVLLFELSVFHKDDFPWREFARSRWYEIIVLIAFPTATTYFCHFAMEVFALRERNTNLQRQYDELAVATQCREEERSSIDTVYKNLRQWFRLETFPNLELDAKGLDVLYLAALHREQLRVASIFNELVEKHSAQATYREQIELAGVLSAMATSRFWATSADSVSQFQTRNHYYLQILQKVGAAVRPQLLGGIPTLARIFIGRRETFLSEVTGDDQDTVLDLYEWHLGWQSTNRNTGADSVSEPLHFFFEDDRSVEDIFATHGVGPLPIRDFMLVDEKLVYGRRGAAINEVQLAFDSRPETIEKYLAVFPDLWESSKTMEEMLDILSSRGEKRTEIVAFKKQCEKRRSKLHITQQYGVLFSIKDRLGDDFLGRTCALIAQSRGICFAVDRADHKVGSLLEAWESDPSYIRFMNASKAAAQEAAVFQRLYILDAKLKGDFDRIVDFIMDSLNARIDVGFRFASSIPAGASLKYDTDFIVTGYGSDTPFGFELQGAGFRPDTLEWTKNLIAKEWMPTYYDQFSQLWSTHTVKLLKGSSRHEVREQIRPICDFVMEDRDEI